MSRARSPRHLARLLLLVAVDGGVAAGSLVAAVWFRRNVSLPGTEALLPAEKLPLDGANVALAVVTFVLALAVAGFYDARTSLRHRPLLVAALLVQIALIAVGATFMQQPYPRTVLLAVPLLEALLFRLARALARFAVPARPRSTLLVGASSDLASFLRGVRHDGDWFRIEGLVSDDDPRVAECPRLGAIGDAAVRERLRSAEEVILVGREGDAATRIDLLGLRGATGFLLLHTASDALLTAPALAWIGDKPLTEVAVRCGFGTGKVVKRLFDLVAGSILFLVSLPLMAVIAVAIAIEGGFPVLLAQERLGLGGRRFRMLKFRSMRGAGEGNGGAQIASGDARVTRAGQWLRRHRLDELPQLINVLRGEMSLVGPRPEIPELAGTIAETVAEFPLRLLVKPGIAGLAQVHGEHDTPPGTKILYDLTYMCGWSPALDVRILLKAIGTMAGGRGR